MARDQNDHEPLITSSSQSAVRGPCHPPKRQGPVCTPILLVRALADKCEQAHNSRMGKILERIRAWRGKRSESSTEADPNKDWKTVGKTFRATDAVYDKSLPSPSNEEGRPRH